MNTIWPVALISFREGIKQRVLYVTMMMALFLMVFSLLFSGLFMRDILKISLDLCLAAITVGGLVIPVFIGVDLVSGDIDRKTVYTILARPISRAQYIFGKFIGLSLLSATVIGILTGATLVTVWGFTHIYQEHFYTSLTLAPILISSMMTLLGILVLNSLVLLWCSITTSSFLATMLTLATYLVGVCIEDVVRFVSLKTPGVSISPVVEKIVNASLYIFPNFAAFDFKQQAAHGMAISFEACTFVTLYGISYITAVLLLAVYIFQRRDLP